MYGFSYVIYMTFFKAYLVKEIGIDPPVADGLWALVGGLSIFCGIIWGEFQTAWDGAGGGLGLCNLDGLPILLFALVKDPWGYIISAVLFGLSAWSIPTIMAAASGDLVGPRLAPAGLGFVTLFFGTGAGPGSLDRGPFIGPDAGFLHPLSSGHGGFPAGRLDGPAIQSSREFQGLKQILIN